MQPQYSPQYYISVVAALHAEGLSDRKIAERGGFSKPTASTYRRKLGLKPNGSGPKKLDKVSNNEARCTKCTSVKPLSEFTVNRNGKPHSYHLSYCFTCRASQARTAVNRNIGTYFKYLVSRLKQKCTQRNMYFDLRPEDVTEMWFEQEGKCFYTDTPMVASLGTGYNKARCSIDKVIPALGYKKENVVLCTQRANMVKNDLSLDEMSRWLPDWHKRLKKIGKA